MFSLFCAQRCSKETCLKLHSMSELQILRASSEGWNDDICILCLKVLVLLLHRVSLTLTNLWPSTCLIICSLCPVYSWYMPCCLSICRCAIVVLVASSYSLCAFTFYSSICLSSCHLLTAAASRLACIEAQVCNRSCSVTKTYCFTLLSHSRCRRLSCCQMLYHYNVKCI